MEMQVTVYSCRKFDEEALFQKYGKELGLKLVLCPDAPTLSNVHLAKGSRCVDILTTQIDEELMEAFRNEGVGYITTRTIGYDHINTEAAKKQGIHVGNAPYGPHGVADYTVMLILMSLRKTKRILQRGSIQDYTLAGLGGRELHDLTVGVIGTGRIGQCVMSDLSGFGCKILAYDLYENESVKKMAQYVPLDKLIAESDVITLHAPLTEDNHHIINKETLQKMRDGVVIVNTARGGLIDSRALIEAVRNGKVGAAGLDVVENEFALYYYDRKSDALDNEELMLLREFPNVTVTHHMAFYTDNYLHTVIHDSLEGCKRFMTGEENPWEVS